MQHTSLSAALAVTPSARRAAAHSGGGKARATTRSCARQLVAGLLLCAAAASVWAQSHEVERGGVVLRSSTVASDRISPEAARSYGIDQSSDRAILNVVLLTTQAGIPATLPALVWASTRSLTGEQRVIEMREVRENDRVSYMGTYAFEPREVIDFEVTAQPTGATPQEPLTLRYRERMWAR